MVSEQRRQFITGHIRLGLLLLFGLFFYACFGYASSLSALVAVLLASGLTWFGGVLAGRSKRPALPVSIVIFLLLAIWLMQKWSGVFILGISFYSLQAIGYLFDVKARAYPAETNPLYILLFLSFFPLSIQGPICRYGEFRKQIVHFISPSSASTTMPAPASIPAKVPDRMPDEHFSGWKRGVGRIVWGAFKKLVIADRIALMTTILFRQPDIYQGGYMLLGLFAYTIQLYADFTGGIDIALGVARCLGFSLPENFNHPFQARSLADYWRRWHISLGSWFRDYIFYPITLSAAGFLSRFHTAGTVKTRLPVKQLSVWIATLLTWSLTGLWHGLEPRFLLWGLLNGGILLLSQSVETRQKRQSVSFLSRFLPFLQMARIFLLTSLLRSLDCYPDIRTAGRQLASVFTKPFWQGGLLPGLTRADVLLLLICFAGYLLIRRLLCWYDRQNIHSTAFTYWLYPSGCVLLLLATLLFGVYGQGYDASGFIYGGFV